ncbi:MAG: site-specific DNA-methyltransferase [Planctomycetota bacterium]|nr:MAG: site-specific DNA-methyltransferase [Planctomycetota bacterium]REJ92015.1 MAG: site-specific DNA-methyltransferase [Planctomycetota bacterium]REK28551.1 MAG: site-specific DNA-methyltransferase [Planctomycetota bacterium]REK39166.1 MAG: site-specific DNA-methyltransferase [Planctomycetota bacterium]
MADAEQYDIIELERATLYREDSVEVLPRLDADHFTACVCDPPYHLTQLSRGGSPRTNDPKTPFGRTKLGSTGFMGKTWDGGDIAFRPAFWAEVLRVLKPGAMLLAFGGTRTFHRLTCAIEDGGFEVRDCLVWMYGSGFPKSLDIGKAIDKAAGAQRKVIGDKLDQPGYHLHDSAGDGCYGGGKGLHAPGTDARLKAAQVTAPATADAKLWDGWGTSLKPAWEPIVLAMKPLDGTFAHNAVTHGVAGLNIDDSRIGTGEGGTREGEPTADKRYTDRGSTNFAPKPGPRGGDAKGRWPANALLDEQAAQALDHQTGTLKSGKMKAGQRRKKSKNKGGYHDNFPDEATATGTYGDAGGASRFFYCAKANKKDRTCNGQVENNHPTVKPRSLMEYLCRLVTPPGGGIILDPFMGSGSTGIAASLTGNRFVGIELEHESFETARRRIEVISEGHLHHEGNHDD